MACHQKDLIQTVHRIRYRYEFNILSIASLHTTVLYPERENLDKGSAKLST